jgi:ribosomal-protein-alanine N-acetyltransferase
MVIKQWLHTVASWGYTSVRTSAMAPQLAERFSSLGFHSAQDLSLLRLSHSAPDLIALAPDIAPRVMRTGPLSQRLRPARLNSILELDAAAFSTEWHMDRANLTDALAATHRRRIFVSRRNNALEGFVLVGSTGQHGFVQRLAVHPDARRSGVASRLLAASLNWAIGHGCTDTVVNTEITNEPAQSLYKSFGFIDMHYGLTVMEREL